MEESAQSYYDRTFDSSCAIVTLNVTIPYPCIIMIGYLGHSVIKPAVYVMRLA